MKKLVYLFSLILIAQTSVAQTLSTRDMIMESCDYHDFNSSIFDQPLEFKIEETRPGAKSRFCTLRFDPSKEYYHIRSERDGHLLEYIIDRSVVSFKLDGSSSISMEDLEKYNLNKDRALLLKDYYYYLWYLPMKLNDPGTYIHPEHNIKKIGDASYIDIKVSYPEQEGSDEWHIYLDPDNYCMKAYQFFKPDGVKGEYILLEGEVSFEGFHIPSKRSWYINETDKFLGADILKSIGPFK